MNFDEIPDKHITIHYKACLHCQDRKASVSETSSRNDFDSVFCCIGHIGVCTNDYYVLNNLYYSNFGYFIITFSGIQCLF